MKNKQSIKKRKKKADLMMLPKDRPAYELEFSDGHYKFLIDSRRGIYGIMPCIGCMPSKGGCLIHD